MRIRTVIITAVAAAVTIALVAMVLIVNRAAPASVPDIAVTASSTDAGTRASELVTAAIATPAPSPTPAPGVVPSVAPAPSPGVESSSPSSGAATWRSDGETEGAWVTLEWDIPTPVNRIRVDGAEDGFVTALVTFDDGSNVLLTPDLSGNVLVNIPEREASEATLTFIEAAEGADSVGLRAFVIDDSGEDVDAVQTSAVTGSDGSGDHQAVTDGDLAAGDVGQTWRPQESPAWLGHTWPRPVTVSSVQVAGGVYGLSTPATLVFSDGSSVPVAGIGPGVQPVTTVAFTPRTVSWVRLELESTAMAVAEFAVYGPGTTPPSWPAEEGVEVAPPAPQDCGSTGTPIGQPQDSALALVCPAPGAQVGPEATVVVSGPAGQLLTASAWVSDGDGEGIEEIERMVVGDDGLARLEIETSQLLSGPFAIRLEVPGSDVPLYVQLFNTGGVDAPADGHAPEGMTLQFEDDFDDPLSVTWNGRSARYAGTKPAGGSGSEFGGAVFMDPARDRELLATLEGSLRIRVEPLGGVDPWGWDRTFASGLLSSTRVGGSGFSAQYGYFEARMLGPAGRGTWPAFWMLDTESAIHPEGPSGEVDAVELYGHQTSSTCHTLHNWPVVEREGVGPHCSEHLGQGDWALEWHTFGVKIRPGGADFFIDGEHVKSEEGLLRDDLPYYFMLNLAVDGGWPVMLDPTGGTADLYVDWVRVYS
ncbi:DUF7402 domain-containing protein [Demequina sp. SO4-13]|uniref:glycoside hydrolase family 16 protein n=1 Tax=Demequina sp. SO4-13 TaxID=3401027 RepID=UPI003AF8220B